MPATVWAHPHGPNEIVAHEHQSLGLEISITESAVVYEILLSSQYYNQLVPHERGNLKLKREGQQVIFLDPEEEAWEREAFAGFFLKAVPPIEIDGVEVAPVFDRFELLTAYDPTGLTSHAEKPPDARVVMRFPTIGAAQKVVLRWTLFPRSRAVDMFGRPLPTELAARLDAADESRIILFTPEQTAYPWTRPAMPVRERISAVAIEFHPATVAVPILPVALTGVWLVVLVGVYRWRQGRRMLAAAWLAACIPAGAWLWGREAMVADVEAPWPAAARPPSAEGAAGTFESLLRNVYRAFDYKQESDVYDVLAKSVAGDLLDTVYQEVYQSLVLQDQGGAVARVKDIDFVRTEVVAGGGDAAQESPAFRVRTCWRVQGVVYHWGHVHERVNEYEAICTVGQRGQHWKITHIEMLGEKRVARAEVGGVLLAGGARGQ